MTSKQHVGSGSSLVVNNSTFTNNTGTVFSGTHDSVSTNGTLSYSTLVGSGIYNTNGGVATVNDSDFSHNNGSGIFNDSTALAPSITLAVADSTFSHNDGGGIVNTGRMTVSGTTFSLNIGAELVGTQSNGEAFNSPVGSGIGNYHGGEVLVSRSTFIKNVGSGIFNYDPTPFNYEDPQMPSSITKATVRDSTFSENIAGFGGGIASFGAVLEVNGSTFNNNSAVALTQAAGGGINSAAGGKLKVANSTFTGNHANFGGGITTFFNVDPAEITNTTLSGNVANQSSGGLFQYLSALTLNNSILANNTSGAVGRDDLGSFSAGLSGSHNLIEDPNFNRPGLTNTIMGDPNLGQLANYGGPTRTMALLPGSPAIDAGNDLEALALVDPITGLPVTTDQRGTTYPRISGAHVDIGAYEASGPGEVGIGTSGDDTITVARGTLAGTLKTTINGVVTNNIAVDGIFLVKGLGGNDTITVHEALAGGVVVDGGQGSDTYTVNYGALDGPVTITDSGTVGTDSITVNGTGNDDVIIKTSDSGTNSVLVVRQAPQPEFVDASGMEHVTIHGLEGNDIIDDPGSDTEIFGDEGDDTLIITATSGTGVKLDGGQGSDTYIVHAPSKDLVARQFLGYVGSATYTIIQPAEIPGPVAINDTGTVGTNGLTVLGTAFADTITQVGDQVVANGETITIAGVHTLAVDGGGGSGDAFTVVGTPTVAATVLGVGDMVVVGTTGDDEILFIPGNSAGQVIAKLNGVVVASSSPTGRIVAYGLAGDDDIQVAGAIEIAAWLYGAEGDDRLNAGNGGSLLIGGDGNDDLLGGGGRDVMIGGNGADRILGNSNDDILVAGFTLKDDHEAAAHYAFWSAVLAEWHNLGHSLETRVQNLSAAGGLLPEVVDDLLDDQIDFLNGGAGDDWLIFTVGEDKVTGKAEASN